MISIVLLVAASFLAIAAVINAIIVNTSDFPLEMRLTAAWTTIVCFFAATVCFIIAVAVSGPISGNKVTENVVKSLAPLAALAADLFLSRDAGRFLRENRWSRW